MNKILMKISLKVWRMLMERQILITNMFDCYMCGPTHFIGRLHQGDIWSITQSGLVEKLWSKYKFIQLGIFFKPSHFSHCRSVPSDVWTPFFFRPGHVQGGSHLMKDLNTHKHPCAVKTTKNHHQSRTKLGLKEVTVNSWMSYFVLVSCNWHLFLVYNAPIPQAKDRPHDPKLLLG